MMRGCIVPVRRMRHPRESGDPVSFDTESLGSRFRGNDTAA